MMDLFLRRHRRNRNFIIIISLSLTGYGWVSQLWPVLTTGLALINLYGFLLLGADKRRAKRHNRYRIPENSMFLVALAGGSLGVAAAMSFFRHKTLKGKFRYGIPILFIFQVIGIGFVILKLN